MGHFTIDTPKPGEAGGTIMPDIGPVHFLLKSDHCTEDMLTSAALIGLLAGRKAVFNLSDAKNWGRDACAIVDSIMKIRADRDALAATSQTQESPP